MFTIEFFITNILLGVGLAMDAFSVSIANGLADPNMKKRRLWLIAGTFGIYQFLMPEIGWICVHFLTEKFNAFQKFIPWIALILLGYIGGKMLIEGVMDLKAERAGAEAENDVSDEDDTLSKNAPDEDDTLGNNAPDEEIEKASKGLGFGMLMVQGIATSIDALSVGFTIAEYNTVAALVASLLIGAETLAICMFGLKIGKTAGAKLSSKATILGGIILIGIGIEVFISNMFF